MSKSDQDRDLEAARAFTIDPEHDVVLHCPHCDDPLRLMRGDDGTLGDVIDAAAQHICPDIEP